MRTIGVALSLCLLLGACSTVNPVTGRGYAGPVLPAEQLASVELVHSRASVDRINGANWKVGSWIGGADEVQLLPGTHDLLISATFRSGIERSFRAQANLKAGHSYRPRSAECFTWDSIISPCNRGEYTMWFEDAGTGEVLVWTGSYSN